MIVASLNKALLKVDRYGAAACLVAGLLILIVVIEHYLVLADVIQIPYSVGISRTSETQIPESLDSQTQQSLLWVGEQTELIYLTTGHCHPLHFQLSWVESVLRGIRNSDAAVFSAGIVVASRFRCGFCHQRAYLLFEHLREQGIEAMVFGLNGHVVTQFELNGRSYLADPDYGVGPFEASNSAAELVQRVHAAYAQYPTELRGRLATMYASFEDNEPYLQLDRIKSMQLNFFLGANIIVGLLVLVSMGLFSVGLRKLMAK